MAETSAFADFVCPGQQFSYGGYGAKAACHDGPLSTHSGRWFRLEQALYRTDDGGGASGVEQDDRRVGGRPPSAGERAFRLRYNRRQQAEPRQR